MNEADFQQILHEALQEHGDGSGYALKVRTYADVGLLTTNAGLVVQIDGNEFQVTIVQSKRARTLGHAGRGCTNV